MATVGQNKDAEATMNVLAPNEQQPAPQVANAGETPQLGAESAVGGAAAQQPQNQASSGLFTGLNKFFNANKGAGQKVGQAVQKQAKTEAAGIGQAVQEKLGQYKTNVGQARQTVDQYQQTGQGALQAVQQGQTLSPEQIAQFRAASQGKTTEGAGLGDLSAFDTGAEKARQATLQEQAEKAKTGSGTFGLLQDFFKTPQRQYTTGQQALDTAFLRRDPNVVKQTQQTFQDVTGQVGQNLEQSQAEADAQNQALAEAVTKAQTGLNQSRAQQEQTLAQQLQQRADSVAAERAAIEAQIAQAKKGGNILQVSDDVKRALGIPVNTYQTHQYDLTSGLSKYQQIAGDKYVSDQEWKDFQDFTKQQALYTGGAGNYRFNAGDYFSYPLAGQSNQYLKSVLANQGELTQAQQLAQLGGLQDQSLIPQEELVGRGLGGEKLGISFDEAAAQAKANQLMEQYFKELPDQALYHPNIQQVKEMQAGKIQALAGAAGIPQDRIDRAKSALAGNRHWEMPGLIGQNLWDQIAGGDTNDQTKLNNQRRAAVNVLYSQMFGVAPEDLNFL